MSFSLDTTAFRARLARTAAALPLAVDANLAVAATLLVVDPPYAAPTLDETGPGPEPDELLTDELRAGTAASIGIVTLYDWAIDWNHPTHCSKCLDYAAGGPYTADFPDRPDTVDTHSTANPCFCTWAEREPTWTETGPEVLSTLGRDIWQDLSQTWGM